MSAPSLGIVFGLPIEVYHSDTDSISNSGLLDLARSPLHFHALHINPLRPVQEAKGGQLEGNLMHCATLEPDAFFKRYAVLPNMNRNTKDWHRLVDAEKEAQGRTCIQIEQAEVAQAQALSLRSLPELGTLLRRGEPEVSAYWIDAATGVRCRCRPDWTHRVVRKPKGVILIDAKSCSDASNHEFAAQVSRKRYDIQAAFYSDGYEAASGVPVMGFVFAAVESTWPFVANAVMLDDQSLEVGRREVRKLLDLYKRCKDADSRPGYADRIELVTLQAWRMK